MAKEEIAQNEQFLLLPQCFPLLVICYPFNYRDFPFFDKICSKSSVAELSYEGKACKNIMKKGETHKEYFLSLQHCLEL